MKSKSMSALQVIAGKALRAPRLVFFLVGLTTGACLFILITADYKREINYSDSATLFVTLCLAVGVPVYLEKILVEPKKRSEAMAAELHVVVRHADEIQKAFVLSHENGVPIPHATATHIVNMLSEASKALTRLETMAEREGLRRHCADARGLARSLRHYKAAITQRLPASGVVPDAGELALAAKLYSALVGAVHDVSFSWRNLA